jgi:hypothetical protein
VASRNSISWWKGGCSEIVSELPDHGSAGRGGRSTIANQVLVTAGGMSLLATILEKEAQVGGALVRA